MFVNGPFSHVEFLSFRGALFYIRLNFGVIYLKCLNLYHTAIIHGLNEFVPKLDIIAEYEGLYSILNPRWH